MGTANSNISPNNFNNIPNSNNNTYKASSSQPQTQQQANKQDTSGSFMRSKLNNSIKISNNQDENIQNFKPMQLSMDGENEHLQDLESKENLNNTSPFKKKVSSK